MDKPIQLLKKYLNQEHSKEELIQLFNWINTKDGITELEQYLSAPFNESTDGIDFSKIDTELLINTIKENAGIKKQTAFLIASWMKYAAIFILAVSVSYLFNLLVIQNKPSVKPADTYASVVTNKGERSCVILPDGSKIWINSASTLTYNTDFSSERKLKLSGEAYFEVVKDPERPFIVETSLLSIKVLGTKFNLRSFEKDQLVQTTLYEGSIAAASSNFNQDILLKPGQQLTYTSSKELTITSIKDNNDMEWKDNIHHFKKQTLENIAKNLERTFNVNVIIEDKRLSQEIFTCEFNNAENLHDILEILRMTKRLTYEERGSQIKISPINNLNSNNYYKKK